MKEKNISLRCIRLTRNEYHDYKIKCVLNRAYRSFVYRKSVFATPSLIATWRWPNRTFDYLIILLMQQIFINNFLHSHDNRKSIIPKHHNATPLFLSNLLIDDCVANDCQNSVSRDIDPSLCNRRSCQQRMRMYRPVRIFA